MSDSTYLGYQVTLTTAIEVMDFLSKKCNYEFLMTARINQDALEASIRNECFYIETHFIENNK